MTQITLEQGQIAIAGALAKGVDMGFKPLAVAVVDTGGHLIAFARQNGASTLRHQIAQAKASGALALGISSRAIGEMAEQRPTFVATLVPLSPYGILPAAGGVIIRSDDGTAIGAIGVTGDLSDNDEICAFAGIEAAGLTA